MKVTVARTVAVTVARTVAVARVGSRKLLGRLYNGNPRTF